MGRLRQRELLRMALRSSCLQSTWNYERQQGLGWAWSLKPALDRLYPDPELRRERLAEHTAYFNTQPTMASLALGAIAELEERRAAGAGPDADTVARAKSVLGSALAALGDRLFWFTLRPFAACLGVLVALRHGGWGALAMWLCYNLVHQAVRVLGVQWGYRFGPEVLGGALRRRLRSLVLGLGLAGTVAVGVLVAELLAPRGQPRPFVFQALLAAGLGLGSLAALRPRPSPTEWALGIGVLGWAATWLY